ncbi:4-hydroxybenzoate polyprenyltransferase, mitochondrial [Paraburkholderia ultramafica]|uniref:4-hydroxybenzoate polyprenyltransferase, mitochondrial n=1 Tax=Paraburkholderia ultramafica TaxID=1544867 RepID=A0A6S7BXQ7_9BURK|nr:UbiA family prenyltransferase [Paraburkholderia ultramafica]CAB3776376.1 4-hydroxybenzoate polyprenyltransferase, mitochondrial [Paraburkholderia ultramafica]
MAAASVPLCVDLDGTLTHTDLLIESFLVLIKKNPVYLFHCVAWLLRGKGYLKAQIAARVAIDVSVLPYNARFVDFLKHEQSSGRDLYLCTAGDQRFADQIASHFGFFTGVMASNESRNLSGTNKAGALSERFGVQGFDYCGNARADIPVWKQARRAIVVGNKHMQAVAQKVNKTTVFFESEHSFIRLALKEMRVYQWVKNLLIFVPLLASHRFTNVDTLIAGGISFLSFCFCASSVYLLNDMLDLDADRRHSRKRNRPFASGELSLVSGIVLMFALLAGSASLALMLPQSFRLVLACYMVTTLAYSFRLKRVMLVDVFVLAGLYTTRIVAGGAAVGVVLSDWLIMFSVMIFLSLAMVKRYTELDKMQRDGKASAAGRGYLTDDMSIVRSFGTAAGYVAVLVLALYMNSKDVAVLYQNPHRLWILFCLLLYWISRMWMVAFRGEMNDDPIVFAIKNRSSLFVIVLCVLTVIAAI